jgi:uncharacterized protein
MKTFTVVMSEACNLNCSYCGLDKKSDRKIDPNLCIPEIHKLRKENPGEIIKLDFFGGEPLMQFPIISSILDEFKDVPDMKFFMPTNGLLLTAEKIKYLTDRNVEISISYDGLWQDSNRKQFTGKGISHRFLGKKELFKGLKCHTMVTNGNYNLLENHQYILRTVGLVPEMTLVRDVGTWDTESVELLKVGIRELFDWYIANPEEPMPFLILFYLRHVLLYKSKGHEIKNCGAGEDLITFSEDKIMPCYRIATDPDLTLDEMVREIPNYAVMEECKTCRVKNYCRKGCLLENIKNKGPITELCDIYKYLYDEVGRMTRMLKDNRSFNRLVLEELEDERT